MATEHISVDHSTRHGGKLRQTHHELMAFRSHLAELKAVMEPMIDGENYSLLEAEFGIETGLGDETYNLVTGSLSTLENDPSLNQLHRRLG